MWKKLFFILLAIAVVTGGIFIYSSFSTAQASQDPSLQPETSILKEGILETTINAIGIVRANQQAILHWKTSGTVELINSEIGDQVSTGQALGNLSQVSLPQNIILAQAELVDAQQALEDLDINARSAKTQAMQNIVIYSKNVKDAQYQLDNFTPPSTQTDLGAIEALDMTEMTLDAARQAFEPYKYYPSGNTLRQDLKEALDNAQSDYNAAVKRVEYEYELAVAQDNLDKARQDYEKWKDGPEANQIAAVQARIAAAQATINQSFIEAPFAGTVTLSSNQAGDQVTVNQEAFRVDDLSSLFIELQVSEVDINQVQPGQDVTLSFNAIRGKQYHGYVTEKALVGNENASIVNFLVTVKLNDADQEVRPGMTSDVEIIVSKSEKTLLAPNQAIRSDNTGAQVLHVINDNGEITAIPITLGASSDLFSEIVGGAVKAGDRIVISPLETDQQRNGPMGGLPNPADFVERQP